MKSIIYSTMLAVFLCCPKLSFGWFVHVVGYPNTACPGTIWEYTIDASPDQGLLTISCTNCLIKNPETGTWQGALIRSSSYGDEIDGFGFDVKFDENESSAIISAQLTFMSGLITVNGNKTVTLGPRPTTPAIISGNGYLANCNSAVNTYNLSNISYNWSLDDWHVSTPLTTNNETSESVQVTTSNTTAYGNAILTAEMHYIEQGITCGVQNITKNIYYGKPSYHSQKIDGSYYYPGYSLCSGTHWAGIQWYGSPTSYSWTVPPDITYTASLNELDFYISNNYGTSFTVNASNICGTSSNASFYLGSCAGGYMMTIYPNPASEELNISIDGTDEKMATSEKTNNLNAEIKDNSLITFDIQVYNSKNKLVHEDSGISPPYKINTSKLPPGHYIVNAIIGENVLEEHLIIE